MANITHKQALRIVNRLAETRATPGIEAHVATVYDLGLLPLIEAYRSTATTAVRAADDLKHARQSADAAVRRLEPQYATVREIVFTMLGDVTVSETLTVINVLTDAKTAIATLFALVRDHSSEPWAAAVLASDFGTTAPDAVAKIGAAADAKAANEVAMRARNEAFDALYPKLVRFKQVIKRSFGASSVHYRGLLTRQRTATLAPRAVTTTAPVATEPRAAPTAS